MVNRFYQVTNFTPWLVKYFDSKRSLHPGPGVEGISLSLELTFHSFDPSSAYCWDNSDAKSEAPKHIPPPFECKPCSIPQGRVRRTFKIPSGKSLWLSSENLSVPCPFISLRCGCPPTVTSPGMIPRANSHLGYIQQQPPPWEHLHTAGSRLCTWARAVSSLIFPAVLRQLYRKRCCVLKLGISAQHS